MTLTVVSSPAEGGNVSSEPASPGGEYYPYDNVTLVATPKPGYVFVNWTGDVTNIEDPTQSAIVVPMGSYFPGLKHIHLTANFAKRSAIPWGWIGTGLAALLIAAVSLAILAVNRKATRQAGDPHS